MCDADISPYLVKKLQQYLLQRGYQPGRVDGLLGKQTIAALTEYQAANGLAVGALTFESLKHLGIE
ncbi:putative peptidoglycan binding domain protein [compost metagenome]